MRKVICIFKLPSFREGIVGFLHKIDGSNQWVLETSHGHCHLLSVLYVPTNPSASISISENRKVIFHFLQSKFHYNQINWCETELIRFLLKSCIQFTRILQESWMFLSSSSHFEISIDCWPNPSQLAKLFVFYVWHSFLMFTHICQY